MKHLKLFEGFLKDDGIDKLIPDLRETFQDLEDKYYIITIRLDLTDMQTSDGWSIPDLNVKIYPPGFFTTNKKIFRLADIKENLLFTISYAKDELGLKLNYLTISLVNEYANKTYENIELVPDDVDLFYIEISFILA